MSKILITGNREKGLSSELAKIWPDATFVSRTNGYDLSKPEQITRVAETCLFHDVFINNSALWKFNQVLMLDKAYKVAKSAKHNIRIICIGSTTDRATKGSDWIYQQEKKALRSFCTSLNLMSTWQGGPQVTLLSLGTLTNMQEKHPDRMCMDIALAASYVKWIVDQPDHMTINELSIDPLQKANWNEQ